MVPRAFWFSLKLLIAAGLVWLATRGVVWAEVEDAIRRVAWPWFALCLGLVVVDRTLMAWRWIALLRAVEPEPRVPLWPLIRVFFVSTFVSAFLPGTGSLGGDAVRALSLSRRGIAVPHAVGSVAVDRLLGIVSVLLMAVLGLVLAVLAGQLIDSRWLLWAMLAAFLGVAGSLLLLFDSRALAAVVRWAGAVHFPTIERLSQKFLMAVRQYGGHRGVLAAVLAASVGVQVLRSAQAWCLGLAIGLTIDGVWYFALIPFAVIAFLLPASVSGLGAGTASFVPLFALAGVPAADAVALSLLFWLLGVLGNLPGGLLVAGGYRPPAEAEASASRDRDT